MTYTWTVDLDGGQFTVWRLEGELDPNAKRGETTTITLLFETRSTFESVRPIVDYAGAVAPWVSLDHTPYYRQVRPGYDPLVGLDPSGASLDASARGIWGVADGGRDISNSVADDLFGIRLDLFVLAEHSDFSDRNAVKTAHET